jgi:hypothetical protein
MPFLNNHAAQHLAAGDERPAYAHFRAAMGADPAFGSAYDNLAQLYLRRRRRPTRGAVFDQKVNVPVR